MKGRATVNIATSANPSSQSLGLPQQHVIKEPIGDHVKIWWDAPVKHVP